MPNTSETVLTSSMTQASRPKRRRLRTALKVLAVTALVIVGGAAAYLTYLNHTVTSNVKHQSLLPTPSDGQPAPRRLAEAKDSQNFLLIGSDSRSADVSGSRSDVIILVHINNDRSRVDLVHFPRDLFVSVPGHGPDKINAAYAIGGAPLLVRTVQNLVHIPIDHVSIVGFEGFKAMTDAVGGVDVFADEPSKSSSGDVVVKGMNHLNGNQALGFVRERHELSQGDISRGKRQQSFIKALLLKGLSKEVLLNPITFAGFTDAATKNLTVDNGFSMGDLRSEALQMRNLRGGDIYFTTAPFKGFGTSPTGASIDLLDTARLQKLSAALQHDNMASFTVAKSR